MILQKTKKRSHYIIACTINCVYSFVTHADFAEFLLTPVIKMIYSFPFNQIKQGQKWHSNMSSSDSNTVLREMDWTDKSSLGWSKL